MQVNEPRPWRPGLTLSALLCELNVNPERELRETDVVEIVRVIEGG